MRIKLLVSVVLVTVFYNGNTMSQTFKIYMGGAYNIHLKGATNENTNIPEEYRSVSETPAVTNYFNNDKVFLMGVDYRFEEDDNLTVLVGLEYESSQMQGSNQSTKIILGDKLKIRNIMPYAGIGVYFNPQHTVFGFCRLGMSIKQYEGSATVGSVDPIEVKNKYVSDLFVRLGAGLDFEHIKNLPITLRLGINVDLGKIARGNVEFYNRGAKVATANPTGDIGLQDNQIGVFASFCYQFNI